MKIETTYRLTFDAAKISSMWDLDAVLENYGVEEWSYAEEPAEGYTDLTYAWGPKESLERFAADIEAGTVWEPPQPQYVEVTSATHPQVKEGEAFFYSRPFDPAAPPRLSLLGDDPWNHPFAPSTVAGKANLVGDLYQAGHLSDADVDRFIQDHQAKVEAMMRPAEFSTLSVKLTEAPAAAEAPPKLLGLKAMVVLDEADTFGDYSGLKAILDTPSPYGISSATAATLLPTIAAPAPRCDCGAAACGSQIHSDWCSVA